MSVADNISNIRCKIAAACLGAGRNISDVALVAVSKVQPYEKIKAALDSGLRVFGENRVQEAQKHWAARRAQYPDLELHLIGPLQANKVKDAVSLFDVIETVDRPALVEALVKACSKQNKTPRFFVQVNVGEEPQKSGVLPRDLPALLLYAGKAGLKIEGLMCLPPVLMPAAPYFTLLKGLAAEHHLPMLSMGMSSDFEEAISLGATHVRIGTALFGDRPLPLAGEGEG